MLKYAKRVRDKKVGINVAQNIRACIMLSALV